MEQGNPELKRAVARLLAADLDLSPADLAYRARMSVNAAKGGRARAKALTTARRRAIAKHAAAARRARRPPMAKGREWGRLYKQRNSRFWWYRIGFQGRLICQSTKTADKRQAAEVLKTKRQELEAARGGFINMPTPDARRITIGELTDALLTDYEVRERRRSRSPGHT
jgi:hypothetical protein